jgi:hypothetical protein
MEWTRFSIIDTRKSEWSNDPEMMDFLKRANAFNRQDLLKYHFEYMPIVHGSCWIANPLHEEYDLYILVYK